MITEDAFGALVCAVEEARKDGHRELGGSLLAHEQGGSVLVAYALPTGPHADRGTGHVLTDAAFQNETMSRILRSRPELQYAGDWHVHTCWLPELSSVDRRTARAILLDDGARRDHLVLLLATAPPAGQPVVLGFVARLSRHGTVTIAKVPLTRVAGDSREVVARLGRPLPALAHLLRDAPDPEIEIVRDGDPFEDVATLRLIEDDLAEGARLARHARGHSARREGAGARARRGARRDVLRRARLRNAGRPPRRGLFSRTSGLAAPQRAWTTASRTAPSGTFRVL